MATKNIKIILEDKRLVNHSPNSAFKIKKVTNSVHYQVGGYLSEEAVKDALMDPWVTVDIC